MFLYIQVRIDDIPHTHTHTYTHTSTHNNRTQANLVQKQLTHLREQKNTLH